jgi:hypothetical protein
MSPLRDTLADYLRVRRRLGFEMPQDGRLLEGFVEFLERAGAERITTELALMWARMPCTTARSGRCTTMRGCVTLVSQRRPRRRSSSARAVGGSRVGSSTGRSPP